LTGKSVTIQWSDLGAAMAFVCVIEGMLPFINPAAMRRLLARIVAMTDRELRIGGLFSMLAGVVLLFAVRA
jgi:uncharacterized protein YjeT (DUF2065 family)